MCLALRLAFLLSCRFEKRRNESEFSHSRECKTYYLWDKYSRIRQNS